MILGRGQRRDDQHRPAPGFQGLFQGRHPPDFAKGGADELHRLLHRRVRAPLRHQREHRVAPLERAEHDGEHGGCNAVTHDGAENRGVGPGVLQGQLLSPAQEVRIEGKLVFQARQIFGV